MTAPLRSSHKTILCRGVGRRGLSDDSPCYAKHMKKAKVCTLAFFAAL